MRGERESEGRGQPVEGAERDLSKIWMRSVPPQAKQGQARQHASGRLSDASDCVSSSVSAVWSLSACSLRTSALLTRENGYCISVFQGKCPVSRRVCVSSTPA